MAIVAIELGFLLAYRAGWRISTAVVTANILVAIALLAVGALAFREPVTLPRLAGIATCLAGLWLVSRG
jgi:drug/metabolite transporter (DMT)-like permease